MSLSLTAPSLPLRTDAHGVVRVGNTRISLDLIILAFKEGASAEEIVAQLPTLDLGDVYAVLGYYLHNQHAVDVYLEEQQQAEEAVLREIDARWQHDPLRARLLALREQRRS